MKRKILIFIVSYQASFRLVSIIKKIKTIKKNNNLYKILISDDNSTDDTIDYIKKIKKLEKVNVIINKKNIGYGANIKQCLFYAIKKKFDYAIMIHGDDQYDAKYIPKIVSKLKVKNTDIVTGSRMIKKKDALKGGMPIYKFVGNIILTKIFNFICKTKFTDCHTGLWGYKLNIFKYINLQKIDDAFNFDNNIRICAVNHKLKIKEIPIKTFYRTETSRWHIIYSLNFIKYLLMNLFNKKY